MKINRSIFETTVTYRYQLNTSHRENESAIALTSAQTKKTMASHAR